MIKINQGIGYEILRGGLFLVDIALEYIFLHGAYVLLFCGTEAGTMILGIPVLGCAVFWAWLSWLLFGRNGAVTLSENGVSYRALLITHHVHWANIRKAGVLRLKNTKLGEPYELVLRKPMGRLEKSVPEELGLSNDWKWIHISNEAEMRVFVEKYYGPLDFDFSE